MRSGGIVCLRLCGGNLPERHRAGRAFERHDDVIWQLLTVSTVFTCGFGDLQLEVMRRWRLPFLASSSHSIVLRAEGRAGHRLTTLAQWGAPEVERSAPYGPWPAAGAMAMAALVLALSVTAPDWGTVIEVDVSGSTTVASVMPDSSFYPMTLR